jgi:hypothetical protein
MIEFELGFNIAVHKNTHPIIDLVYTLARTIPTPTERLFNCPPSWFFGTKIAVTASKDERARARVKKEEILNIITIDKNVGYVSVTSHSNVPTSKYLVTIP